VRKLVRELSPFTFCVQETKLVVCDDSLCAFLWGDTSYAYSYRPLVGASGGLLSMWDTMEVEVWSSVGVKHVLQIHGRFIQTNEEFYLFNIYAPCDVRAKHELWVSLSARLQVLRGKKVCVCGDFNTVWCGEERRSQRGGGGGGGVARKQSILPFYR